MLPVEGLESWTQALSLVHVTLRKLDLGTVVSVTGSPHNVEGLTLHWTKEAVLRTPQTPGEGDSLSESLRCFLWFADEWPVLSADSVIPFPVGSAATRPFCYE